MYERLRCQRMVMTALDQYARELKNRHQRWKEQLGRTRPGSASQIASEALELALKDMEDRLSPDSDETHSLDETANPSPPE
jgi:predicted DNA-binding protein